MDGVFAKASTLRFLVRQKRPGQIPSFVGRFWNSEIRYVGLQRDLTESFSPQPARIPITIRPLSADDVEILLDTKPTNLPEDERILRFWQRQIVKATIPTCYVAVNDAGIPCFM